MLSSTSVRQWREALGLTQVQAALAIGYSPSRFSKYDQGKFEPPLKMRRAMDAVELERKIQAA